MPILQVRDVPEDLYDALTKIARQENRSISQETIVLLRSALKLKEKRVTKRRELLSQISDFSQEREFDDLLDPVNLIREDRDR